MTVSHTRTVPSQDPLINLPAGVEAKLLIVLLWPFSTRATRCGCWSIPLGAVVLRSGPFSMGAR